MAVMAAGVVVAPLRLAAQQAAPNTAAPATAAQEAPKAQSEAPKTQEEQNNVFRLEGPIVKWSAKTFGLSVETTAAIFDFLNLGLIVLLVGIPIARSLSKVFHKQSQTLVHSLKTAREETTDANTRLIAVEAKLAGLDEDIKKFRA